MRDRRQVILNRITQNGAALHEVFEALDSLDYYRNFDECVALITQALDAAI